MNSAHRIGQGAKLIEVVCPGMMCFKVDAETLDPVTCIYYEPAALNDPRGPQMSYSEWIADRSWNTGRW